MHTTLHTKNVHTHTKTQTHAHKMSNAIFDFFSTLHEHLSDAYSSSETPVDMHPRVRAAIHSLFVAVRTVQEEVLTRTDGRLSENDLQAVLNELVNTARPYVFKHKGTTLGDVARVLFTARPLYSHISTRASNE
jgi:hypothetical protein